MNILALSDCSKGSYSSYRPELEIFLGLAQAGHNVTIVTDKDKEHIPYLIENGIQIVHCRPKHKISFKAIKLIRNTIKKDQVDIVYAMSSRTIPNAAFSCTGTKVKLVVYRGTTGGLYRHDPSTYLSVLHPRVNGVICVSHAVEKCVRQRMWKHNVDNIVTIHKGHRLDWYTRPKADLSEFDTHKDKFNVVCVANARRHKGLIYMLRAAQKLADLENLHILLVGKKISQEPYTSAIKHSGMQERIHLTGYRTDAPEIIAACDVLVVPSIREGLPRVILESLAYHTPVITSANEGSMEIIEDNVNGYVVPVRDDGSIAQKIRHLHDNPKLLKKLSDKSHDKLKSDFNSTLTVEKHINYFQSLLVTDSPSVATLRPATTARHNDHYDDD